MKNLLVSVLCLFAVLPGWSQVNRGTHALGTTMVINRYEAGPNDNIESRNFSLTPEYAYFFADNLSVLVGSSFGSRSRDTHFINPFREFSQQASSYFRANSAIRKHIPIQDQLFLIGTIGLEYEYNNFKSDFIMARQRSTKTYEFGVYSNVGLIYFPTNRWSLELIFLTANLHRIRRNYLLDERVTRHTTTWNFHILGQMSSPSFGIRYNFLGNRK